ncbi:MAG: hypothetical protein RR696_11635 [Clostridia bacterium]
MKKVLCFVIAGMIASCSTVCYAASRFYSISELNLSGIPRWTQSYETKWRTVHIDVQPTIPKVEKLPVLTVSPLYWEPDLSALDPTWTMLQYGNSGFTLQKGDKEVPLHSAQIAKKYAGSKRVNEIIAPPIHPQQAYLPDSTLTLEDAMNIYHELETKVGLNFIDTGINHFSSLSIGYYVDAQGKPIDGTGYYDITAKQHFYHIPLVAHAIEGLAHLGEDIPGSPQCTQFRICMPDSIDYGGVLLKETGCITADMPICDFLTIRTALEKEIEEGHIRRIFHMELGYVMYNTPGKTIIRGNAGAWNQDVEYYAVPAWRVDCWYFDNPKEEVPDYKAEDVPEYAIKEYVALLVNAQTGEILDRNSPDKRAGDYTGFTN